MIRRFFLSIRDGALFFFFPLALVFFLACSENPKEVRTINVNPLIAEGKLEEAATEITRVLAEYPNHADLLYNLALIQRMQGKIDVAQRTLSKALSLSPNDDAMNYLMIEMLIDEGRIQDTWDRFQMLSETFRKTARSQYTLGIIYSLLNNWPNAESAFRTAIGLGDSSPAVKSALAFITCKQGRLEEGKAYLLEAETAAGITPEAMNQIAECHLLLEQAQKSRDIARRLIEQFPLDARYWSLLGRAEMKLLNFGDAETAFTRALACPNTTPWIQVQYAEMLYASQRDEEALAQAMDAEMRIAKLNNPTRNPSLYNLLATLYAKNGQTLLAQRYLNQSYQIDPSQSQIQEILNKITTAQEPNLTADSVHDATLATP